MILPWVSIFWPEPMLVTGIPTSWYWGPSGKEHGASFLGLAITHRAGSWQFHRAV
jgi:hypothetical protein